MESWSKKQSKLLFVNEINVDQLGRKFQQTSQSVDVMMSWTTGGLGIKETLCCVCTSDWFCYEIVSCSMTVSSRNGTVK